MPGPPDATAAEREGRRERPSLELPPAGRVVEGRRKVRMADVGPDRRARLDALARYLHDVAEDDAATAALPRSIGWVLRRTRMEIGTFPVLGEDLVLTTFCSGTASRWAERTTFVAGANGARARATSIWVAVDATTGAPARLGEWFSRIYAESARGRRASAKLTLDAPSAHVLATARPWPLRRSDVDAWGHVNNAIAWAALEDAVEIGTTAVTALVEHQAPITAGTTPLLAAERHGHRSAAWLVDAATPRHVFMAAALERGELGERGERGELGEPNRNAPRVPQSPGATTAWAVPRSS